MALKYTLVDIIPYRNSGETGQNSEPSIAVNPLNPTQMIAGTFGNSDHDIQPYWISTDGGAQWTFYDLTVDIDKSLAWLPDGSAVRVAWLLPGYKAIDISSGTTTSGFGIPFIFPGDDVDQPWIVVGPSNQVYVGYNDLGASNYGASVLLSQSDGNYTSVLLDRAANPNGLQDAPSIRLAVNGSTAYATFVRWNSTRDENSYGDYRYHASLMIVRSDTAGADNFTALGTDGNGVQIASMIAAFSNEDSETNNSPLTLGQERTGSDLAIAVDPNNAAHVVVVYQNAPGEANSDPSQLQLVVMESWNGGASWGLGPQYITSLSTRSGQPAVAISSNGTIGLLYDNYDPDPKDPKGGKLSQHFLTTMDDFGTVSDTTLATESNRTPSWVFNPYVGDFFNLISIGNTFYGTFSASNDDNGKDAHFPRLTLQRSFTGTAGKSSFQLTDEISGNSVAPSIDPFFFSATVVPPVPTGPNAPPPANTTAYMILNNASAGFYLIYDIGNNAVLTAYQLGQVGTNWQYAGLGGFYDGDTGDMLLRNSGTGDFQVYDISLNNIINSNPMGAVGLNWQVSGFGNFSSNPGETDMIMRNTSTGQLQVYDISNNQITNSAPMGAVGLNWQVGAFGNFSSLGESDMIMSNTSTGQLQVYDISNNQITYSALIGTVGTNWQIVGAGNFSSVLGESDLMMQNTSTGEFQLYDIANNQITASFSVAVVGPNWQVAGFGPISANGASDMVLRDVKTGAFKVYDISHNAIIANSSLGAVGLDWQLGGFASDAPTLPTGGSGQVGQLVQAMAGFGGGSDAAENLNTAALSSDTAQQPLLATSPHG
jgi:hypothetical protein